MRSYRIVCVGSACGKTAFLSSLSNCSFSTHSLSSLATVGADFIGVTVTAGDTVNLGFFDCSSLELFSDLRVELYKEAHALILFFSDKASFLALEAKWLIETREISAKPLVPVLVGQLPGSGVPEPQAASWAETRKFKFVKCSSDAFLAAVCDALKKK